ncbi:MAG: hypothetical protein ACI9YT_002886 [Halobacteriales archaeon]|jgi:hypothetical protein
MALRDALTLGRSGWRGLKHLLDGRVRFPRERVGDVLEFPDGNTSVVYRETVLDPASGAAEAGVVLVFRMQVADPEAGTTLRAVLFDPVSNVATPFFAGLPGFRRKLWLAGDRPGEFLELYGWATRADADRFVDVLQWLLAPFDFAGNARFDVVEADGVDEYVADRAIEWRGATDRGTRRRRRSFVLTAAFVGVLAIVAGYLVWRGLAGPGSWVVTEEQV